MKNNAYTTLFGLNNGVLK